MLTTTTHDAKFSVFSCYLQTADTKKKKKEFKNSKNTFCDTNDLEYMKNYCRNAVILSDEVLVVVDFVLTVTLSLPRGSPLTDE